MKAGRLYWQCRRGMRELDLLLLGFLDTGYEALDAPGRAAFARLLRRPDQELLDLLMGRGRPVDGAEARVVDAVRRAAAP